MTPEFANIVVNTALICGFVIAIVLFIIWNIIILISKKNTKFIPMTKGMYESLKIINSCILPFIILVYALLVKTSTGDHHYGLVVIANVSSAKVILDMILFTYSYIWHKKNDKEI